ncbi:type II toxin-antitoxin system RelE family toxin [Mycolicibacterium palauense]|uniref:type II toxin-antitoxin system RelE family toxin n=1 Tax=Mycolicibacterium palauense TaxID=2034511 RepID=UPI00159B8D45|nr:type II toxin-antitoxin system RelE/ParE family toxin [Mycolicibacterium palauense]
MARVELTDDAKDDIRGLDGSVKARVLKDLLKLEISPADRGAPLGSHATGNLTGLRKLYIGPRKAYRAVFAADGDVIAIVVVVAARSESECYELALTRMRLLADAEQQSEMTRMLMSIMGSR